MSITKTEMYFEIDEDDPENKKIDPKVNYLNHLYLEPILILCDSLPPHLARLYSVFY